MPTNTTNFGLIKPGQEEFYNVDVPNNNMDTIDGVLKALQDAINSGASEQDLTILRDALATHLAEEASLTEAGHVILSNLINGKSEDKAATEKAISDAIIHVKAWGVNRVSAGGLNADPNTTDIPLIVVQGNTKAPTTGIWYIHTNFYEGAPTLSKSQIAISYAPSYGRGVYWRDCFNGTWQPWVKMIDETMRNVANGFLGLDASGNIPGMDKYVKLAEANFATNPTVRFALAGLSGYKKIRIVVRNVYSEITGSEISVFLNGYEQVNDSTTYYGSRISNGNINSFYLSFASFEVRPTISSSGVIDIDNDPDFTFAEIQQNTLNGASVNFQKSFVMFLKKEVVHTIAVMTRSPNRINKGTLEVWGVPR